MVASVSFFSSSVVRVKDHRGRETEYELVGRLSADATRAQVTPASPAGEALMGARSGSVVSVSLPNGRARTLTVVGVYRGEPGSGVLGMIRLALLDDHPAVLAGLQRLLAPRGTWRCWPRPPTKSRWPAQLRRTPAGRPDRRLRPGRGDALALCRRVKARPVTPRVLDLHRVCQPGADRRGPRCAGRRLLDKSEPAPALIAAIRRIADGETVLPTVSRGEFEAAVARLADTDLPIFAMLLDGAPVPAIAEGLRTDEREAARRAQKIVARSRRGSTAATARSLRSRLDQSAADRVAREFDPVAHAELLEDVRAVALDGLLGDVQQRADLVVGMRFGDELDDLLLARGEQLAVDRPRRSARVRGTRA